MMKKGFLGAFLAVLGTLMLVFFLQHDRYQDRIAHFAELEATLLKIRMSFMTEYMSTGRFPRNNQEADLPDPAQLKMGALDGLAVMEDQRVWLRLKVSDSATATVFLTPEVNSADQFLWHCRSPDLPTALRDDMFGGCKLTREHLSLERATALQWRPKPVASPPPKPAEARMASVAVPVATPDCTVDASSLQVLAHDTGLGVWDLSARPVRVQFIPYDVKRADAFFAQIGNTLFVSRDNAIAFADITAEQPVLENSTIWTKPGTRLYGIGKRLVWVTAEQNLFVGDVCQLPAIRIIHTMKLELGRRESIIRMEVVDDLVYLLSRHESDWGNSSELNIYRMKENGTLVHRFHFNFDGQAHSMQLAEPYLMVANGREGVTFYERTLDQRWMQAQKLVAVDFAMDVLLRDGVLWVADGGSGLLQFRRAGPSAPWQRAGQQMLPFPAFRLHQAGSGLLVSSATQHGWYDPARQTVQLLEPPSGSP